MGIGFKNVLKNKKKKKKPKQNKQKKTPKATTDLFNFSEDLKDQNECDITIVLNSFAFPQACCIKKKKPTKQNKAKIA